MLGNSKKERGDIPEICSVTPVKFKLDIIGGACAHLQTVVVVNAMVRECGGCYAGRVRTN